MCSITEALTYATAGIFGTLAVGILWMKIRGDYQDANVGRWLGVLGIITLFFLAQDWVCGWPSRSSYENSLKLLDGYTGVMLVVLV